MAPKSRLAKAAGAEPSGQMRDEKLREADFEVKMHKTPQLRSFWKLRCRKSTHSCSAKHISKSTCTKHTMFGPLLEVELSKKCTPLRREAHFQVKMLKTPHAQTTFGRSDVVWRGRRKGFYYVKGSVCESSCV